jgi:hypothetical protein
MVQLFVEGLKPELKHKMNKQAWLTINDEFRKTETLDKLAEQKKNQLKISQLKVNCIGPQSGRGAPANKGQSRGGRGQFNNSNNQSVSNNNSYQSASSQRGRGNPRGRRSGRGQYRVSNNNNSANCRQFPSAAGKQCRYCLKLNHFAKDCRDRIAKGHAIPFADIEEGLYNEDYFTTPNETQNQNLVDSVHENFNPKNKCGVPAMRQLVILTLTMEKPIILYPLFWMY